MGNRDDAIEILHRLIDASPRDFFSAVDEVQRGTGFVLAHLVKANGEVVAGDLAKGSQVSTARIAALLKTMEKNGLITRRSSAKDARQTIVEITPAGRARAKEIRDQIVDKIEVMLDQVGRADVEEFIRISAKIKRAMKP